jgi:hypothetical protein
MDVIADVTTDSMGSGRGGNCPDNRPADLASGYIDADSRWMGEPVIKTAIWYPEARRCACDAAVAGLTGQLVALFQRTVGQLKVASGPLHPIL